MAQESPSDSKIKLFLGLAANVEHSETLQVTRQSPLPMRLCVPWKKVGIGVLLLDLAVSVLHNHVSLARRLKFAALS